MGKGKGDMQKHFFPRDIHCIWYKFIIRPTGGATGVHAVCRLGMTQLFIDILMISLFDNFVVTLDNLDFSLALQSY